jgi:pyrroloquinoline-quinone synthase
MRTSLLGRDYEDIPKHSSLWDNLFPPGLLLELREQPFLRACREGGVDIDMLRRFLVQQHYYSQYFTRYLCATMASLTESADVHALAENLFEEMGLNEENAVTHAELYQQCMRAAGARPASEPMLPETRNLIDTMFRYCRSGDALEGLAALCLGAEAIVPEIYEPVLIALRRAGVPADGVRFFVLHVAEDEAHAIVMRRIIDRTVAKYSHRRAKVIAIGEDIVRLRMAILQAVYDNVRVKEEA